MLRMQDSDLGAGEVHDCAACKIKPFLLEIALMRIVRVGAKSFLIHPVSIMNIK